MATNCESQRHEETKEQRQVDLTQHNRLKKQFFLLQKKQNRRPVDVDVSYS